MNGINNILVALDLSSIDESLIEYAHYLATKTPAKKVFFVHNIKKYEMSSWFEEEFEDVNLDEIIGNELQEKVDQHFTSDIEHEILISEDPNTESLVNYIVNKYAINLVCVGMKNSVEGAGVVGSKLLRLVKSDLLFIPERPRLKLDHILIGSDFSRNSRKSFTAFESAKTWFDSKITAAHVYHVPFQFSTQVPIEKLIPKIQRQAREHGEIFLEKLPKNLVDNTEYLFAKEMNIAQKLSAYLRKTGADMMVLSDRGANNYSTLLIGSLTEEIFNEELSVPYYIVK